MAYPHLPGVTLNLADLGLKIAPPPAGPKVTLLGVTCNTGVPLLEPLSVTNVGKTINALWASGATSSLTFPSELALAVEEASAAGAENIEILVIANPTGNDYDYWIDPTSAVGRSARFSALSGAYDVLLQSNVDVVHPVNAWIDNPGSTIRFGSQLANFCHQKSKEFDNTCVGVLPMMTPVEWAQTMTGRITGGGFSFSATVSGEMSDVTGAADRYFGSASSALVTEWAKYASNVSADPTCYYTPEFSGYLAGSEDTTNTYYPTNYENEATAVNSAYWTYWQAVDADGTAATDQKGNKVDAGRRVCVFGCPVVTNGTQTSLLAAGVGASLTNTVYNTNGAAAYAARITTLAPQSATTNKPIYNLTYSRPLSGSQANKLAGRRITTMHNRANGFVVTSGITGAHNVSKYVRSDFVRLTTIRIVDSVVNLTRSVSDKYIGEPNTATARNALYNDIEKYLKQMRVANALRGWTMYISSSPDQQVLGEATIDLTLVPAFELVKIECNIALAKSV